MPHKRESISIDGTGATVTLEKPSDHKVNVRVDADAAITIDIEVSDKDGSYFQHSQPPSASDIDETGLDIVERFVRVRVTTGTGGSGDTADVLISSGGTSQ